MIVRTLYFLFLTLFSFSYSIEDQKINKICVYNSSLDTFDGPSAEIAIVKKLPEEKYKLYSVNGVGSFYIDDIPDWIKSRLRIGEIWEPYIIEIMKKHVKANTLVLDIGAHIGTHTVTLSKLTGAKGSVIAFEPQLKIFAELSKNLKLNECKNVKVFRCVLGDSQKSVFMNKAILGNEGSTMIGGGGDAVEMITLDSLELNDVSFIKIDTENTEYEVLLGAKKTIERNRPIMLIEIMGNCFDRSPDKEKRCLETKKLIESMRYQLKHIAENDWLATPL